MGVYLNPGCQRFSETVQSQIYVDKTEMISFLNTLLSTEQKYISVSRPRRFGKSITANMLCAYYGRGADSRTLFADKELAVNGSPSSFAWDRYLGAFDVIRIVMTDFFKSDVLVTDSLKRLQTLVVRDLRKAYPHVDFFDCDDLPQSMSDLYAEKANRFVVIIDEWDAVFRIRPQDKEGQTKYLDFLRDWLKDKDYIALAYMTGILPIKKYGQHSALNMFFEFSMTAPMQLARYTGFTEEEVSDLCRKYGRNFEEIRSWYDGYQVSDIIPPDPEHQLLKQQGSGPAARKYSLYSPLSVVNAVSTGFIQNYWNRTETYEALADYIRMDFDDLQNTVALMMEGARIRVDVSRYQNDMTTFHGKDDVLALLIHLGYLGYDMETQEAFVPNKEILEEFRTSTQTAEWGPVFGALKQSQLLLEATWSGDAQLVAELLENSHNSASNTTYNSEAALSYAVQLAYYCARKYYTVIQELDTGKGYADLVFLPAPRFSEKPAMLIELKFNQSAETALNQIRKQSYPDKLQQYKGNLLLVGINYTSDAKNTDPLFKHHSCRIERA